MDGAWGRETRARIRLAPRYFGGARRNLFFIHRRRSGERATPPSFFAGMAAFLTADYPHASIARGEVQLYNEKRNPVRAVFDRELFCRLVRAALRNLVIFSMAATIIRKKTRRVVPSGFTLIELLVVAAIMIGITAIVLANNNKFGGKVLLQNLAYDIALSIRQAQVYGIAVLRYSGTNFTAAYGIHVQTNDTTHYELFADIYPSPPDGLYSPGNDQLIGQQYTITRGNYIYDLCATPIGANERCARTDSGYPSSLDMVFKRPDPDACIAANGVATFTSAGRCALAQNMQRAKIVVASPRNDLMCIVIEVTGQIAVESTSSSLPSGSHYCP